LLNPKSAADFNVKRRWDDDVIFKNQARGADERGKKKEFVNDLLRSDFHKKFMVSSILGFFTVSYHRLTGWCRISTCVDGETGKVHSHSER